MSSASPDLLRSADNRDGGFAAGDSRSTVKAKNKLRNNTFFTKETIETIP